MRILQAIETSGPGGAEQVMVRLSKSLSEAGHDVVALLLRDGWVRDALDRERIPSIVLPLHRGTDPRFARRFVKLLRDARTDVLHSHEVTLSFYGRLATAITGTTHVATAHGVNFARGARRRVAGSLLFRPSRKFRLVAVSRSLAAALRSAFYLGPDAIEVIPNGIEVGTEPAAPRRRESGPLRLVAVGNLYPVKNHALLIRAVAALRAKGVPAELDVLGRGGEEAALRDLVRALGVGEAVRLQGFREDVGAFLERAHVFVSSSSSEGMPISFLEAMRWGLPIVASRVGGVPELVTDGVEGLLFPSGDVDLAVACLERLASDEPLRRRLGEGGAATVRESHSVDGMVRRYLETYARLGSL